jgi:hypothetical protein
MRLRLALLAATLAATSASAQNIGVAACDNFLKTYETCVGAKAPAAQQGQMRQTIEAMRANFRNVAQTADGKKQLETVCKQTADQLKQQAASLGCNW